MRAGVGSGGRFRKVPEGSGVCWCRFRRQVRRQVPEGSGGFRCVHQDPVCAGVGSGCNFRRVPESVVCCLGTLAGAAM